MLERLQIADLLGHGASLRTIARELGRSASTVSRELHRHTDEHGRYQPHQAEQAAQQQRQRPRQPKLLADTRLHDVVQRKLNRYWSPEQIAGWLRAQHIDDPARSVCTETIYRALIVPSARCLHIRYTGKLHTGRALRRSHANTRSRKDGAVRNMTMIKGRPTEVQDLVGLNNTRRWMTANRRPAARPAHAQRLTPGSSGRPASRSRWTCRRWASSTSGSSPPVAGLLPCGRRG